MTRTLLVIDDNKSVRESLRFLFTLRGYEVLVADCGPAGIALARERAVDGAMVDVNMPGMNGLAVCRALRAQAQETGRPVAVWMMTGARTAELTKAALEAGALTVFPKPFDFRELFQQFDEQLGGAPSPPPPPPDALDAL
jgi:DNA-binding response OmpR family regulator